MEEIFKDPKINEIIDDRFDTYVSKKEFETFKNKEEIAASNNYNIFSWDEYSQFENVITDKIKNIVESKERAELIKFLGNVFNLKQNIIIIAGASNI